MCIDTVVSKLLHMGECWRWRKGLERLLQVGRFSSQHGFSLSRQSFLVLCRDNGFCVATGFGFWKGVLGSWSWLLYAVTMSRPRLS